MANRLMRLLDPLARPVHTARDHMTLGRRHRAWLARELGQDPLSFTLESCRPLTPGNGDHQTWEVIISTAQPNRRTRRYIPVPGDMVYLRWENQAPRVRAWLEENPAPQDKPLRYIRGSSPWLPGRAVTAPVVEILTREVDLSQEISRGKALRDLEPLWPRPFTLSLIEQRDDRLRLAFTLSAPPPGHQRLTHRRSAPHILGLGPGATLEGWCLPDRAQFPHLRNLRPPLVCLCTGSGLSPVLALLRSGIETGPLWVIHGVRTRESRIAVEELESYVAHGRIHRLDWVYSREGSGDAGPRRIPRFLEDNAAEVRRWIGMGTHFYLCGLAGLKTDVRLVLEGILSREYLDSSRHPLLRTLDAWEEERRFQASVSGGQ